METKLLDSKGKEIGKYELPEMLFAGKADPHFLHEIIKYYLANKRRGTASTKTRGEISGGGKKPWKQKGTGRARQGSIRSPLWRKGGVVFGPRPRSYRQDMPETKLRHAVISALSAKHAEGSVFVVENLDFQELKTKGLREIYGIPGLNGATVLFVMDKPAEKFIMAARNIPGAGWSLAANLNAHMILSHNKVVFTVAGLNALARMFGPESAKKEE